MLLFFITLISLNHTFIFRGGFRLKNDSSDLLIVTYKGKLTDLSSVKHIEISYKTDFSEGKIVNNYGEDESISSKTFKLIPSSSNTAESEVMKVTINLDGEKESLILKSSN